MKISPITSFHRLANQPIAKRAVSKTDSTLPEYMSIPNSAYISQIQPNFKQNSRIVRDIEIDDYRKMTEYEKEDLREIYDNFYKLIDMDELYTSRGRTENSKMPLDSERDMDDFIALAKEYCKYKDHKIICVGRSPKWFLNAAIWMENGIPPYDFVAFSSNWYSRRGLTDKQFFKPERFPNDEQMKAYREYVKRQKCSPQDIVDAAKVTGNPVIITDYIHSGCGLTSFLDILARFAKEDGILDEFANSIKLFTISSMEYFDTLEIDNSFMYPTVILPDILKPYKIPQEYHDMSENVMKGILIDKNTNECRSTYYPPLAWPLYQPDLYYTGFISDEKLKMMKKVVGEKRTFMFKNGMKDYRNIMNFRILDSLAKRKMLKH